MKFSAVGRRIIKEPVETKHPDGSSSMTLGFPIAEVMDHVKNGDEIAKAIAQAMTECAAFT